MPRRTNYVEPQYPASALDSRVQGTVRVEITIARDGRVADARVVESVRGLDEAALAAVRRWEFAPSQVGGAAVPVLHVVEVGFTPPARPAAPAPAPAPPPAVSDTREPGSAAGRKPATDAGAPTLPPASPTRPDPAAEQVRVRETLKRYEAAWESRDAAAVARLQQLSGDELSRVRDTLAGAREYAMTIDVKNIRMEPDARRATATCSVTRRFRARVGDRLFEPPTATQTFTLERRGDGWVITSVR